MHPIHPLAPSRFAVRLMAVCLCVFSVATQSARAADPVDDLEDALDDGDKNILFEGKEGEDVTIEKGVSVTGTSPAKAVINGDIIMEDGSSLSNVTVNGKLNTITIEKGASVTLSNVNVHGGDQAGIYAPYSDKGGTITIRNSNISKNQKGLYILPGKTLNVSGSSISNNKEEGMDLRADVRGRIVGSRFIGNGEGGAEIIISNATFVIDGSTFSQNKASGIAFQSYPDRKIPGKITVSNNVFSGNGSYGIICKQPQGGDQGRSFFAASLTALENRFSGNRDGTISTRCGTTNQIAEEEEKEEAEQAEPEVVIPPKPDPYIALDEKSSALFSAEHKLELLIHEKEKQFPYWKRLFKPLPEGDRLSINASLQAIDGLRDAVSNLPRDPENSGSEEKRQGIVLHSLERKSELQAAFDRLLKKPFSR